MRVYTEGVVYMMKRTGPRTEPWKHCRWRYTRTRNYYQT